jgi:hypothetical protein
MIITHHHRFAAGLDTVVAMLADEQFTQARGLASGAAGQEVAVDGSPDAGFTVSIRRTMPVASIPAEVRALVGRDLSVIYTEVWEAPGQSDRAGTFALEIVGAPGHVSGAMGLTPDGDATDFFVRGEVKAPVPLFGPMIERAVGEAVTNGFDAELTAADEWLAAR